MIRSASEMAAIRALVAELRNARFSGGVRCPRCDGVRVQRWGGFSGRQRYRCKGCGRTFSDFTGSPVMYSKKILQWVPFSRSLQEGASVRRAAARSGIHPDTSFRWRHALLEERCRQDREKLVGWIELAVIRFAYSQKGRVQRSRVPRRRGVGHGMTRQRERVYVLVAADRVGGIVSCQCGAREPGVHKLHTALAGRIARRPTVVAKQGRYGAASAFARRLKGSFHDARRAQPDSFAHVGTAQAYVVRLEEWMTRFRGVATRYLPNYLAWHRTVDRAWRQRTAAQMLRWPLGDTFG